jgi:aromatic-L-amino-acid decarboxylase
VLRSFGLEGIRGRIRHHIGLARDFADWVDGQPGFERMAPAPFSVVCFRARPPGLEGEPLDHFNLELLDRVNASGEIYLSHTRLDDGIALRVAIGNLGTTAEDVARCQRLLTEELQAFSR